MNFKITSAQRAKFALISGSFLLMVSFQNCANSVKFQSASGVQSKTDGILPEVSVDETGNPIDLVGDGPSVGGGPSVDPSRMPSSGSSSSNETGGGTISEVCNDPLDCPMPSTGGGTGTANNTGTNGNTTTENSGEKPTDEPSSNGNKCEFKGKKFKLFSFVYRTGSKEYEYKKQNDDLDELFDLNITVKSESTDLVFTNGAEVLSIDGTLFNNAGKRFVKHFNDIDEKGHACEKMQDLRGVKNMPVSHFPRFENDLRYGHFKKQIFISMFETKVDIKFDCAQELLIIGKVKFKLHHDNGHHFGQFADFHDDGHGNDHK